MYTTYLPLSRLTLDTDKAETMLKQDIIDQMRKNGEDPAGYEFELTVEKEHVKLAAKKRVLE